MGLGMSSLRVVRLREDFTRMRGGTILPSVVLFAFVRAVVVIKNSAFSRVLRNDFFYSCGVWDGHVGTGF